MGFLKGTILHSIIKGSCPVCHNESMYVDSNPYHLRKVISMNERCSHCQTKYQMEPSFFYGAMYVSYAVGVAIAVASFIISHYLLQLSLVGSFISIIIAMIALYPIILRTSRNIWINLFLSYDKEKSNKND